MADNCRRRHPLRRHSIATSIWCHRMTERLWPRLPTWPGSAWWPRMSVTPYGKLWRCSKPRSPNSLRPARKSPGANRRHLQKTPSSVSCQCIFERLLQRVNERSARHSRGDANDKECARKLAAQIDSVARRRARLPPRNLCAQAAVHANLAFAALEAWRGDDRNLVALIGRLSIPVDDATKGADQQSRQHDQVAHQR